jgi:hypothetical protein
MTETWNREWDDFATADYNTLAWENQHLIVAMPSPDTLFEEDFSKWIVLGHYFIEWWEEYGLPEVDWHKDKEGAEKIWNEFLQDEAVRLAKKAHINSKKLTIFILTDAFDGSCIENK